MNWFPALLFANFHYDKSLTTRCSWGCRTYTYHHVAGLGVVVVAGDNCGRETLNQICILARVLSTEDLVVTVGDDDRHDVQGERGLSFRACDKSDLYPAGGIFPRIHGMVLRVSAHWDVIIDNASKKSFSDEKNTKHVE